MTEPSLLPSAPPLGAPARSRVLEALRREAALPPPPGWRRAALTLAGTVCGLVAVVGAAGLATGQVEPDALATHLTSIGPALAVALLGAVAAFVPGGKALRRASLLLAGGAAALLVASRGEPAVPSSTPGWVCTLSHVASAVVPALVALASLKRLGLDLTRSLAAGLSVGAVGALLGELACQQGPLHVLAFHLPAWAFSATAVALLSTRLQRSSHAP